MMPKDPEDVLLLIGLLGSLGWLALHDIRRFEISPLASIATALMIAAHHLAEKLPLTWSLLFALSCYAAIRLLILASPTKLGEGDATLFALVAFATGPSLTRAPIDAFIVALFLSSLTLLLRRRKRLRRWRKHLVPVGPAAAAAILAALGERTHSLPALLALFALLALIPAVIVPAKPSQRSQPCNP